MAATTYFDHVIDPETGQTIEVCDKYAREQLVHKTEKTVVNSLPAKPTTQAAWLEMERFIYYVPSDTKPDTYEAWTLFFTVSDPTAADYTDPDNYEWVQLAVTDTDLNNFSTHGHTHEVIPETEVEDHEYTPQGTVSGSITDAAGTAASNGSHSHGVTVPSQNVTGTLSGTESNTGSGSQHRHAIDLDALSVTGTLTGESGTTGAGSQHRHGVTIPSVNVTGTLSGDNGTTGTGSSHTHGVTPTKKKLSTKKMSVSPATTVDFTNSTKADRADGDLDTLSSYDASKAVFNGISVNDGVLSFVIKKIKMVQNGCISGLSASIDASRVTYNNSGTANNEDIATGQLADGQSGDPLVMTDVSVNSESSHTHSFTPSGNVSGTTASADVNTEYESGHNHGFTPAGSVSGTTSAITGNTGYENEHTHGFTPAGTVPINIPSQTVTSETAGSHTHDVSVSGDISASFQGLKANLKHKVDNKKLRTAPDQEDEGSHAFDWYGILFDEDEMDPHKTRVGNMDMHRMLPIQTKMRRCLLNDDGTVNYYLDDRDSTKKAGSQEGWVESEETFISKVETDDIRDNTEYIDGFKGNSMAWKQLVSIKSSDISKTENNVTFTDNRDGSYTIQTTNDGASANTGLNVYNSGGIVGHVYLETGIHGGASSSYCFYNNSSSGAGNYFVYEPTIFTAQNSNVNIAIRVKSGAVITTPVTVRPQLIDLTLIFGSGNEPTTVEQFEAWLAQNVGLSDYYPYDAGSILKTTMKGIKTTNNGVVNTYPFDVTKVYGQLNGEGELAQVFPNGMRKVSSAVDILTASNAIVRVTERTYESGDESDTTVITDMSNTIYALSTPLTYTNLVYRDNGVDIPLSEVFFPNGIVVGKGGTVEIQPQNTESIVTCAPTMTMKKYVLQAGATLDGSDGQVMVEIPEHWRKVYTYLDGTKTMVKAMVSPYPQTTTGWVHVKKGYISAYEANIDANDKLCSTSDIKDLVLSVVDGKVNASCDVSTIGETDKPADWAAYFAGTHSQLPTTSVTMDTLRTAARARGNVGEYKWNMLVYEQYLALYWLFVIEYANLNSQEAFTTALTSEGFHQGGLGNGVTTVSYTAWGDFNSNKPFVPCGITNCLGNHSGEVILALPSAFGTNIKVSVNSYRGVEMPFGHIWKFADGIKYLGDGTQQAVLRCDNPENYSSGSSSTNYESIGNNVGSDGYKKKIMVGDDGDINCEAVGGGSNQAYCDYNNQAQANGTYYCCLLFGDAYRGARAGLAFVNSAYGVTISNESVGSRLCFFEK